ncbi:MAG: hypothetical protein WD623_04555 [Marinobacter sp.]|uniref:hypothetical protein n=1 Tax=Marinobacter sp. TaxID=50741 RepID=UPI0034A047A9
MINVLSIVAGCLLAFLAYWIISRPAFGELLPSAAPWLAAALHFVIGVLWARKKLGLSGETEVQ